MGAVAMDTRITTQVNRPEREPVLEMRPWFTTLLLLLWNGPMVLAIWFGWPWMWSGWELVLKAWAILSFAYAAAIVILRGRPSLIPLFFRCTTTPGTGGPGWLQAGLAVLSGIVAMVILYRGPDNF
jgi:hypothetical protein